MMGEQGSLKKTGGKTPPFVTIMAMIYIVLGVIVMGIGIDMVFIGGIPIRAWSIVAAGSLTIVVGGLFHILYPYAHRWFNKDQSCRTR